MLAEADQLVVLTQNLRGATGEVEGEGSLIGTEVVDVENELLGEVLGVTPDGPADTGVNQTVLVAGYVDGNHTFQSKVPLEVGVDKRSDEATRCSVDCSKLVRGRKGCSR